MKKLFFAVVLTFGALMFVNAQDQPQEPQQVATSITQVQQDEWKDIKPEALPAKVLAELKELSTTNDIMSIKTNEATKQFKVALVNKEDKSEKEVVYNEDGTVVK